MPSHQEDLDWVDAERCRFSQAVATSVRTAALGVIAAIWAIYTADKLQLQQFIWCSIETISVVKLAFTLAVATLFIDVLHMLSAYRLNDIAYFRYYSFVKENTDDNSAGDDGEFEYSEELIGKTGMRYYSLSDILFWAKVATAFLSAFAFIIVAMQIQRA